MVSDEDLVFVTGVVMLFVAVGLFDQHRFRRRFQQPQGPWEQRVLDFVSNIPQHLMTSIVLFCCWGITDEVISQGECNPDHTNLILYNVITMYLMPRWCYLMCVWFLMWWDDIIKTKQQQKCQAAAAVDAVNAMTELQNCEAAAAADAVDAMTELQDCEAAAAADAVDAMTELQDCQAAAAAHADKAAECSTTNGTVGLILGFVLVIMAIRAVIGCWWYWKEKKQQHLQRQRQQEERMNRQRRPAPPPPAVAELLLLPEAFAEVDDDGDEDHDHDE